MTEVFTASREQSFTLAPLWLATPDESKDNPSVVLIDGQQVFFFDYSDDELARLQYDQEIAFAAAIVASPKKSTQRITTTRHAYQTVCKILDEIAARSGNGSLLSMGMDARYIRLVLEICRANVSVVSAMGSSKSVLVQGLLLLLRAASEAGHRVAGLEVAPQLLQSARQILPSTSHDGLMLGDFPSVDLSNHRGRYSLVYWNDVFEHIPVDEITDYLTRIRSLLAPGGKLLTITPNWHMRPSDVTCKLMPPRSEASGFHLKEYTLGEVRQMLLDTGFSRVQTPAYISRRRIWMAPLSDCTFAKTVAEPLLEWLPYKAAVQCCRRFGFNCSLATN